MKKIIFFAILLSIIFYGFLSNYSKKKEMKSFLKSNTVFNSSSNDDDIYGCESSGIIPTTYCRLVNDKCRINFLEPLSDKFGIVLKNKNSILHCTTYKLGVDSIGFDIVINNFTNNEILKEKENFKKSKLTRINSFQPGEGLCIKPKSPDTKYGIISDPLRKKICLAIEDDIEVNFIQKLNNHNYLNIIDLGFDNILWLNKTGY